MLIAIDPADQRPVYSQIASAIKDQVRQGTLRPGDELPSVRELAGELGINLHTARHAYQVLQQQGIVHIRLGSRARIAPLRSTPAGEAELERRLVGRLRELVTDAFHLGLTPEQFRKLVDDVVGNEGKESANDK